MALESLISVLGKDERSRMVTKNAMGSFAIKALSLAVDFAKVPLLLVYLDAEHYGVYLTIVSIMAWTQQFDFGLGAGLRYKLTEALACNDTERSRHIVSTAYLSMSAIMLAVLALSVPIILNLDWNGILNTTVAGAGELSLCALAVLAVFVVQFVLELISVVLQAEQRAAISNVFKPLANLLTLGVIAILITFSHNSLLLACLAMTVPVVMVLLVANIYFFHSKYAGIAPAFSYFGREYLKDIYSLGLKFFASQFSSLLVFQTATFLIAHFVNPTQAAVYNTAWTYFGVIVMFNTMVLQPLVAAVTDAYVKDDWHWIDNTYRKIRLYSLLLTVASLVMLALSQLVFKLWVGDKLIIPWGLCIVMTLFFIINIWNGPYTNFLGGVGKMNVMAALSAFKIVAFIPVAVALVKLWGTIGVVVAIIVINSLPNFVFSRIQFHLIRTHRAAGIWNS